MVVKSFITMAPAPLLCKFLWVKTDWLSLTNVPAYFGRVSIAMKKCFNCGKKMFYNVGLYRLSRFWTFFKSLSFKTSLKMFKSSPTGCSSSSSAPSPEVWCQCHKKFTSSWKMLVSHVFIQLCLNEADPLKSSSILINLFQNKVLIHKSRCKATSLLIPN